LGETRTDGGGHREAAKLCWEMLHMWWLRMRREEKEKDGHSHGGTSPRDSHLLTNGTPPSSPPVAHVAYKKKHKSSSVPLLSHGYSPELVELLVLRASLTGDASLMAAIVSLYPPGKIAASLIHPLNFLLSLEASADTSPLAFTVGSGHHGHGSGHSHAGLVHNNSQGRLSSSTSMSLHPGQFSPSPMIRALDSPNLPRSVSADEYGTTAAAASAGVHGPTPLRGSSLTRLHNPLVSPMTRSLSPAASAASRSLVGPTVQSTVASPPLLSRTNSLTVPGTPSMTPTLTTSTSATSGFGISRRPSPPPNQLPAAVPVPASPTTPPLVTRSSTFPFFSLFARFTSASSSSSSTSTSTSTTTSTITTLATSSSSNVPSIILTSAPLVPQPIALPMALPVSSSSSTSSSGNTSRRSSGADDHAPVVTRVSSLLVPPTPHTPHSPSGAIDVLPATKLSLLTTGSTGSFTTSAPSTPSPDAPVHQTMIALLSTSSSGNNTPLPSSSNAHVRVIATGNGRSNSISGTSPALTSYMAAAGITPPAPLDLTSPVALIHNPSVSSSTSISSSNSTSISQSPASLSLLPSMLPSTSSTSSTSSNGSVSSGGIVTFAANTIDSKDGGTASGRFRSASGNAHLTIAGGSSGIGSSGSATPLSTTSSQFVFPPSSSSSNVPSPISTTHHSPAPSMISSGILAAHKWFPWPILLPPLVVDVHHFDLTREQTSLLVNALAVPLPRGVGGVVSTFVGPSCTLPVSALRGQRCRSLEYRRPMEDDLRYMAALLSATNGGGLFELSLTEADLSQVTVTPAPNSRGHYLLTSLTPLFGGLTTLRLAACKLKDAHLQILFQSLSSSSPLLHLDLSHNPFGDKGGVWLSVFHSLSSISLVHTNISITTLQALSTHCRDLVRIDARGCSKVDGKKAATNVIWHRTVEMLTGKVESHTYGRQKRGSNWQEEDAGSGTLVGVDGDDTERSSQHGHTSHAHHHSHHHHHHHHHRTRSTISKRHSDSLPQMVTAPLATAGAAIYGALSTIGMGAVATVTGGGITASSSSSNDIHHSDNGSGSASVMTLTTSGNTIGGGRGDELVVMIVGPPRAGKSTVFKQFRQASGESLADQTDTWRQAVQAHLVRLVRTLCDHAEITATLEGASVGSSIRAENKDSLRVVQELSDECGFNAFGGSSRPDSPNGVPMGMGMGIGHGLNDGDGSEQDMVLVGSNRLAALSEGMSVHLQNLWEDPAIQAAFTNRHLFQLDDMAHHFLTRIGTVAAADYVPTKEDVIRCRSSSSQHSGHEHGVGHVDEKRLVSAGLNIRLINLPAMASLRERAGSSSMNVSSMPPPTPGSPPTATGSLTHVESKESSMAAASHDAVAEDTAAAAASVTRVQASSSYHSSSSGHINSSMTSPHSGSPAMVWLKRWPTLSCMLYVADISKYDEFKRGTDVNTLRVALSHFDAIINQKELKSLPVGWLLFFLFSKRPFNFDDYIGCCMTDGNRWWCC
jgi:hypothetical protein